MGLRTSGSLSALYCGSQGSTTGLPMLGRPLGNGEAKVVYRGYGCRIGHQLGAVEAREVQWGNGSKIKNVLALEGLPNLYRRVSLGGHGWSEIRLGLMEIEINSDRIPPGMMWKPDILLYNSANEEHYLINSYNFFDVVKLKYLLSIYRKYV